MEINGSTSPTENNNSKCNNLPVWKSARALNEEETKTTESLELCSKTSFQSAQMWSCATFSASYFSDFIIYTPSWQLCSSADTQILRIPCENKNLWPKLFLLLYSKAMEFVVFLPPVIILPSLTLHYIPCVHPCVCARGIQYYDCNLLFWRF